jgi:hypothetical protein
VGSFERRWRLIRDIALFVGGLAIGFTQVALVFVGREPHYLLIGLAAAMLGLPAFLKKDGA